ncbi:MAG: transketolase [Elusimicrobiota bacterium]
MNIQELIDAGKLVRKDIINMIYEAGSGHPGGSLSCVEIMVSLYWGILKHDPKNPAWEERDRVIFSKGHVCPTLYSCLARKGYFDDKQLCTLRKCGTKLQGHPGYCYNLPGIETTTGSLGQGLSIGVGMALGMINKKINSRVYVLLGDGELQSGQIWEAVMSASHFKLDNLCAIVDNNNLQIDGFVDDVMSIKPLKEKWESFGWHAIEIDGHNFNEILDAYKKAMTIKKKPTVIIAKTIKGKGISFMENIADWHGKSPNAEQRDKALQEIENKAIGI